MKESQSSAGPTLEELLEAGVHFGHQKRRWDPKIAPFLYNHPGKIHVFDLIKTREALARACACLEEVAESGGPIIFVGTKRQASPIIRAQAAACGALYVDRRWLGGTLTNFSSVRHKIDRLKRIEKGLADGGEFSSYTKKERLDLSRELSKLELEVGGLKNLATLPAVLFIVDVKREATAVAEARKKGVKTVAVVDSNCSPLGLDFPIPGNDDSTRSLSVLISAAAAAVQRGYSEFQKKTAKAAEKEEPREVRVKKRETLLKRESPKVKKGLAKRVKKAVAGKRRGRRVEPQKRRVRP